MRDKPLEAAEKGRIRDGAFGTEPGDTWGAFLLTCPTTGRRIKVIVGDGEAWKEGGMPGTPWEHVSVSTPTACPLWEEMCWVRDLFWREDEVVMQLHPAKNRYVNEHQFCLHLWRCVGVEIPTPPLICV